MSYIGIMSVTVFFPFLCIADALLIVAIQHYHMVGDLRLGFGQVLLEERLGEDTTLALEPTASAA